jgi:hypothetical protein
MACWRGCTVFHLPRCFCLLVKGVHACDCCLARDELNEEVKTQLQMKCSSGHAGTRETGVPYECLIPGADAL